MRARVRVARCANVLLSFSGRFLYLGLQALLFIFPFLSYFYFLRALLFLKSSSFFKNNIKSWSFIIFWE